MKTIGVVTGTRADYGIYRPVLRAIEQSPDLDVRLLVCGAHLSSTFGNTVEEIEHDGFAIAERLRTLEADDSPAGITRSMSNGLKMFGNAFARFQPDILLVLGDRYEMFAAAAAALPFNVSIAHIHGGEVTEGAMDEAFRHAITKISTLHFATTQEYAARIRQMGENPDCIFVTGAPGLDNIQTVRMMTLHELEADLGLSLTPAPLLVTFHPETLDYQNTEAKIANLLLALEQINRPIIITHPNADTYGRIIIDSIDAFASARANVCAVASLGTDRYFSLMAHAAVMVGNSSSGIIEAASFKLPVVNIGTRQKGRIRASNVIDVNCLADDILSAIEMTLSEAFRAGLADLQNPYGDGNAAGKIARVLAERSKASWAGGRPFFDLTAETSAVEH